MRATKAIVSLEAIRYNVGELRKCAPNALAMAVVKADAYGHGAVRVAQAAVDAGASWLGVATVEEGRTLLAAGVQAPILVMGVLSDEDCALCVRLGLCAAVSMQSQLDAMQRAAFETGARARAHLKIETGFHRLGVDEASLAPMLDAFSSHDRVEMEGIFTHFATADMRDDGFVFEQIARFEKMLARVRACGFAPLVHLSNSAATLRHGSFRGDIVRLGIAMYGCPPSQEMDMPFSPKPALSWVSEIGALNRVHRGETVGYGRAFTAGDDRLIATVPVGYADGYARAFGGRAHVLVGGQRCPVVGRVCMDHMMVDVSAAAEPKRGDAVVLLGAQGADAIHANDLAQWRESIDYEVLTAISCRVPREYTP